MALFAIPTSSQFPWYVRQVQLSNAGTYTLELRYNTRMERWIMSIYDLAMSPLLLSIPLLINRDLSTQYRTLKIPPGVFFCADGTGSNLEPVLSSFLTSHELFYVDSTA